MEKKKLERRKKKDTKVKDTAQPVPVIIKVLQLLTFFPSSLFLLFVLPGNYRFRENKTVIPRGPKIARFNPFFSWHP